MELYANEAQTALDGDIDDDDTTITVLSATGFPSDGNFRIRIGNEFMKVTAVSGSDFTVVRGDGGSTAVAHDDGDIIYGVLTKEALEALVQVQVNGTDVGDGRRILNFQNFTADDDSGNSRVNIQPALRYQHTNNVTLSPTSLPVTPNAWEDVPNASLTFTPGNGANLLCIISITFIPQQAGSWNFLFWRLDLDGSSQSANFLAYDHDNSFASGAQFGLTFHWVFPSVSSGSHTVKLQVSDANSGQKAKVASKSLTILY